MENNPNIPDIIELPAKKIIQSKIIWTNLLAVIALLIQQKYGFMISVELQTEILAVINIILRTLSDKKLTIL